MARTRTIIAELHKLHLVGNKRNQPKTTFNEEKLTIREQFFKCLSKENSALNKMFERESKPGGDY